jgi:hypothetical protein
MEDEKSIIKEFINGGWIIPMIGAAAMIARLMSAPVKMTLMEQLRRIISAAISSSIAWFILEQTDFSSFTKAVTYGIIGVISPEIIAGIIKLGKMFQNNPEKFIKK